MPWLTFLGGLSLDALTQGPLGYFALVYLMAYVMAAMTPVSSNRLVSWLRYAPALVVVLATAWLVSSLYMLRAQDVMGYIEAGAVAFCAFPVLSWLLQPLTPAPVGPGAATYTRGAGL